MRRAGARCSGSRFRCTRERRKCRPKSPPNANRDLADAGVPAIPAGFAFSCGIAERRDLFVDWGGAGVRKQILSNFPALGPLLEDDPEFTHEQVPCDGSVRDELRLLWRAMWSADFLV